MTKHNIPLTYKPKIPFVLDGTCRQTIRAGGKFKVNDLISFHGWEGKPYHSKWSFRTPYLIITNILNCVIFVDGIQIGTNFYEWHWRQCEDLAKADGIDPPTGEELGKVLTKYHKIPEDGLLAQIIRW